MLMYSVRCMETWVSGMRERRSDYFKEGLRTQFKTTVAEFKSTLNIIKKKKADAIKSQ